MSTETIDRERDARWCEERAKAMESDEAEHRAMSERSSGDDSHRRHRLYANDAAHAAARYRCIAKALRAEPTPAEGDAIWQVWLLLEGWDGTAGTAAGVIRDARDRLRATAAVAALVEESAEPAAPARTVECQWRYEADGFWATGCDEAWAFGDGGPAENRVSFCPFCGGTLTIHEQEEAPHARD